jgi:hypothetical protein
MGYATLAFIFSLLHPTTAVNGQDTLHLKKYVGDLRIIDVSINGSGYTFLFDTGGGETLISPGIAKENKKCIYGSMNAFRMHGEMITFQKADSIELITNSTRLYHPSVGVWDVMSVLPPGLPRLDGVLSLKSFVGRRITLDLVNNRIIVETEKSYQKKVINMTRHTSRFANGLDGNEVMIFLEEQNAGRSFWFLIDTGNLGDVLLSPGTATAWGLKADSVNGSLGKVSFKLGSSRLTADSIQDRIIYDGALNYFTISNFTVLIDLLREEVWIGTHI